MAEWAFMLRERCGCVVAVIVEDDDFHYAQTLADWRRKATKCRVEKATIEAARTELGRTIEAQARFGVRHWRKIQEHAAATVSA